jgi:hypothetical protein
MKLFGMIYDKISRKQIIAVCMIVLGKVLIIAIFGDKTNNESLAVDDI